MSFEHPGVLALILVLAPAWRLLRVPGRLALSILRSIILLAVVLYFAGPHLDVTEAGRDIIVIADRSASMAAGALADQSEIIRLLNKSPKRLDADRIGVISFANSAALQSRLERGAVSPRFDETLNTGSRLSSALSLAAQLAAPRRDTRLLLLSDGLYTGEDPLGNETLSAVAGLPVWYRYQGKPRIGDVAAGEIVLPNEVHEGAGYLVRFSIESPNRLTTEYALYRNGELLTRGEQALESGLNHFFVRDIADRTGILEYVLETRTRGDTVSQNNESRALLKVVASPRVLIASKTGASGLIAAMLEGASVSVDSVAASTFDWSPARLTPYRLVVLENLPLDELGPEGARSLARAVESGLVALLVTGGEGSLGQGGYHKSALDPLLPTTQELREEQRRGRMAVVAALDRSGSMGVSVTEGMTKMDLANAGVAEAIRLLSPLDQVAAIAVDSEPHVVVPLSEADDTEELVSAVLRIKSEGGGIFVRTALDAAVDQVRKSKLPTRHILLFADAADSEEQGGCLELARQLRKEDVGISVVGLGTPSDKDADFLEELARKSGGKAYFTDRPTELPRIFSQEVIRVARRGFIKQPTRLTRLPDLARLQMADVGSLPMIGAFNLSNPRPGASVAAITSDDYKAPVIAFWQKQRASAGVIAAEVDGQYSGELSAWSETPRLLVNLARTLVGPVTRASGKAYAEMRRGNAELRIELDEHVAEKVRSQSLKARLLPPTGGEPLEAPLTWRSSNVASASVSLPHEGHWLPVVDLGEFGLLEAPPLSLPYSPEYLPRTNQDGEETLGALARATGGGALSHTDDIFLEMQTHPSGAVLDLSPWLALLILVLLLVEIAERRLRVFDP